MICKKIFFCAVMLLGSLNSFAIERSDWSVSGDKSDSMYASMYFDNKMAGRFIDVKDAGVENMIDFLSTYYQRAINNDKTTIVGLYYEGDGSRKRLIDELVSTPEKFTGFKNLDKVEVGTIFYWGNYRVFDVVWHHKNGKKYNWLEMVYCENRCYISDRLYKITNEFELLSTVISSFKLNNNPSLGARGEKFDFCPEGGVCEYPLSVYHDSILFSKGLKLNRSNISEADSLVNSNPILSVPVGFFKKSWNVSENMFDKNYGLAELTEIAESYYLEYWIDFDRSKTFSFTRNGKHQLLMMHIMQSRIFNLNSVEFVSYLTYGKDIYVYLLWEDLVGDKSLQVFLLKNQGGDNNYKLSLEPANYFFYSIATSPVFVEKMLNALTVEIK